MAIIHRHGDTRNCGATTIASGQATVTAGGMLIAVVGDQNTHSGGAFVEPAARTVSIGGIRVIIVGDTANVDGLLHTPSAVDAATGLATITIG